MRPAPFDTHVPGNGYRWWYLDANDPGGQEALVIILFVGSVFSPYYRLDRDRGRGRPGEYCAMNVALYGRRRKHWAMTERRGGSVRRERDLFRVGPSTVHWSGGKLHFAIEERCAPFGQRMRGAVTVEPTVSTALDYVIDGRGRHRWRPWAPRARVRVDFDRPGVRWEGEGYLDGNDGSEPLEAGFLRWDWSRCHEQGGVALHYDMQRRDGVRDVLSVVIDERGEARPVDSPPERPLRRAGWGVQRHPRAEGPLRLVRTLEDTPFYTRNLLRRDGPGSSLPMVHESLSMERFDRAWVRCLLPFRMPRELRAHPPG